jgi:hypothetical protein
VTRLEVALAVLATTLAAAACAGAPAPAMVAAAPAEVGVAVPVAAQDGLAAFAGSFAISGQPMADGCAGQIYLAARTIVVDARGRTLFADVVDRTYAARAEAGSLVAEGYFEAQAACPETAIFERWVLSRRADGGLEGVLDSLWPLAGSCGQPCLVRFEIVALPTQRGR